MKKKTAYLLFAGIFAIATFFLTSDVLHVDLICIFRIQKTFFIPVLYFSLIGLSKKSREVNPLGELLVIVGVILLFDFSKIFLTNGIDWFTIGFVAVSGVVSYFIRWFIDSIFTKAIDEK